MGVVFEYNNQSYVNVVGNAIHYAGNIAPDNGELRAVATEETFKKIESRYLNAMIAQISQGVQVSGSNITQWLKLIQGSDKEMSQLIHGLEEALAKQFNDAVESFDPDLSTKLVSAKQNIRNAILALNEGKGTKTAAYNALDNLFNLAFQNQNIMAFYNTLSQKDKRIFKSNLQDVMGYTRLKDKIRTMTRGANIESLGFSLQSLLTSPTEFFPDLIDAYAKGQIGKQLISQLQGAKTGTHGKWVIDEDLKNDFNIERKIKTQAADSQFIKRHVTVQFDSENPNVKYEFSIQPFVSTKVYESGNDNIKLVGHNVKSKKAKSDSILLDVLHQLYGTGADIDYKLYNSLAFKDYDNKDVLNTNFRIIRSDLTANLAEKFIIGFTSESFNQVQTLFIYNQKAYPMISIISKIVEQGINAQGRYYGNFEENDLFRINIVSVGNQWIGNEPSIPLKAQRVKQVVAKIARMGMQGTFNPQAFEAMFKNFKFSDIQGITLDIGA